MIIQFKIRILAEEQNRSMKLDAFGKDIYFGMSQCRKHIDLMKLSCI